jgi:hypothetical protein
VSDDGKKVEADKGFAGLTSLLSDVEVSADVKHSPLSGRGEVPHSAASTATADTKPESSRQQSSSRGDESKSAYQSPPQAEGAGSGGKWILGLGVVALVVWGISQTGNNKTQTSSPGYSTTTTTPSTSAGSQPSYAPSLPSPAPLLAEEMPNAGSGNVLGADQIRYCLAEDIRLASAKQAVNEYTNSDVDRFNSMVADYNSRCSNDRYRRGALESVRSEVERFRTQLEAEGRGRFSRGAAAPLTPDFPQSAVPQTPALKDQSVQRQTEPDLSDLTSDEQQSIEMACLEPKVNAGPKAYDACVKKHLRSLKGNSRHPDLSRLSSDEQQSIEMACLSDKVNNGPAAYNRCVQGHVNSLGAESRRPDISQLSSDEQQSIEMACLSQKVNSGPAAYNKCIGRHLASLGGVSHTPDQSRLTSSEQQSIDMACLEQKVNSGPAAYNRCLERQIARLKR